MAKQSKNDASIRSLLLKSGTVHPTTDNTIRHRDLKASQQAAIAARRAEMNRASTSR